MPDRIPECAHRECSNQADPRWWAYCKLGLVHMTCDGHPPEGEGPSEHPWNAYVAECSCRDGRVTASVVVVQWSGLVLLLLRAPGTTRAGTFCLPGGHIDGEETPHQAALRELREETTLRPSAQTVESGAHQLTKVHITVFHTQFEGDQPPPVSLSREHVGFMWVDPRESWVHQLPLTGDVVRGILRELSE